MAGQNPGFTPLGYAGNVTDATRTAQAYQDERSRYLDVANQIMGSRQSVELPAGVATTNVIVSHDLGRVPRYVVASLESASLALGTVLWYVVERGVRTAMVRIESNLGAATEVDVVALILP